MWFLFIPFVLSLTPQEYVETKAAFLAHPSIPSLVAVVDAPLARTLAYTTTDLQRIYMDFRRLRLTPKTRHNVLIHELGHASGGVHGDGSPAMSYSAREGLDGNILEDDFVLA